jgi:Apea-like HEPN
MMALEALLGDGGAEITHKLAQRSAALVSRSRAQRLTEYGVVKDLYRIRSKLVHGSAQTKKGVVTWDSLHISAKRANVPVSKLDELGRVVN